MSQVPPEQTPHHVSALLHVADYLSRPQQFIAVADARAAFRRTLEMVRQASVVLTTNGEPAAALVPFATLEAMRGALLHLLVDEMDTSFTRLQAQVTSEPRADATNDEELDALVDAAVQRGRRQSSPPTPRTP